MPGTYREAGAPPARRAEVPVPAELLEIFSAIQGEGPSVGERQIFVRFGRCDVACTYCDTPLCHSPAESFRVERTAGRRDFQILPNPVPPDRIAGLVLDLAASGVRHRTVSLTGGEPLLHAAAIAAIAPRLRTAGLRIHIETNGHLPDRLALILTAVDEIGMDVKIPSTAGFPARPAENRRFLALAATRSVAVKVVVAGSTPGAEIDAAAELVATTAPETPFILQPVTPGGTALCAPSPDHLLRLQEIALRRLEDVRVIPQTHRFLDQL